MSKYEDFIDVLREKTGWKEPKINAEKRHYFTLSSKGGEFMDLEFFTPEGATLIIQANLIDLPKDDYNRNEMIKEYANKQVAACKKRASVLSLDNNHLILYKKLKLQDMDILLNAVNDFLKDVDWWLQKNEGNFASFSPFSMASWNK